MDYFAETDRLPEAFTLVLSMKSAGITPSDHTYAFLNFLIIFLSVLFTFFEVIKHY